VLKTPLISLNYDNLSVASKTFVVWLTSKNSQLHTFFKHSDTHSNAHTWSFYFFAVDLHLCSCVCKLCCLRRLAHTQSAFSKELQGTVVIVAYTCQPTFFFYNVCFSLCSWKVQMGKAGTELWLFSRVK